MWWSNFSFFSWSLLLRKIFNTQKFYQVMFAMRNFLMTDANKESYTFYPFSQIFWYKKTPGYTVVIANFLLADNLILFDKQRHFSNSLLKSSIAVIISKENLCFPFFFFVVFFVWAFLLLVLNFIFWSFIRTFLFKSTEIWQPFKSQNVEAC